MFGQNLVQGKRIDEVLDFGGQIGEVILHVGRWSFSVGWLGTNAR